MTVTEQSPLSKTDLERIDAYWRAANYLSVGQIYLLDNPLLTEPLRPEHIKPRLLGHWGTTPGLNLIYAHANRVIRNWDLNMIYVTGPGHGGPGIVANTYLEGTYTELYPNISQDAAGMQRLFRQFSFPGGIPSHVAPETPGSIHEGGELGYSLSHAFGAVFDNPDLIALCVVGDGEAETGPLATGWHSNKFLDAAKDGAVLPILHLNGYKIANPTVLARIPEQELVSLFEGYGYTVYQVTGDDPEKVHQQLAATFDQVVEQIGDIQRRAREDGDLTRPRWPMIVLTTPKGWTGPKVVDGLQVEGTFRAHQVPIANARGNPEHLRQLEEWMRSYRPQELFGEEGKLAGELAALAPRSYRRMSANPHANGGLLRRDLNLPDFRDYAVEVARPGTGATEPTRLLGRWLRDVIVRNPETFRLFGPDETASNRLDAVFEVTNRAFDAEIIPSDDHLAPDGRVMEVLSEHQCEGWLEGYLLTGRHGLFNCYEAFIHIVDSMFNQHAKWLESCNQIEWRRPVSSLNYLLSSLVWRQDHNGFSHQDPGFLDVVLNKRAEVVRVYLPPDANTLLSVGDHCLRSRNYVNVIVAGKQPQPDWLSMNDAIIHCTRGAGIWEWASNDSPGEPDVVLACCGDVPTLEILAAVDLIRQHLPELKVRVVNVVDLMRLLPETEHPHGMSDAGVRLAVHGQPAGHLRVPRVPVADPPAGLQAARAREPARARVQGARHHHDALRHGAAQRPGPVPPGDRRHRPGTGPGRPGRPRPPADDRPPARGRHLHPRARRGHAVDPRLGVAVLMRVLVVNAGSSSLKLSLLDGDGTVAGQQDLPVSRGQFEPSAVAAVLGRLGGDTAEAVGHRIVHGGRQFTEPVRLDAAVRKKLEDLVDLAPLHQPKSLAGVDAVSKVLPGIPAVACFDTAFHAGMPAAAATYAIPPEWRKRWELRKYGFHGLSHAYATRRAGELLGHVPARLVVCHLGSGASLAAVRDGRSVDTTMGFTPLDGLVMGTRSGPSTRGWCSGWPSTPARRRPSWPPPWTTGPGCWGWPGPRTCVRCWPGPTGRTAPRTWPCRSTCTVCAP